MSPPANGARRVVALVATLLVAAACGPGPSGIGSSSRAPDASIDTVATAATPTASADPATPDPPTPSPLAGVAERILPLTGSVSPVHDPSIARDGSTYYLFTTGPGIPFRCSDDLLEWRGCGQVFLSTPEWAREAVPGVEDLWAPDISKHGGRYFLYYSASTFGSNRSAIGLATNVTLDPDSPDYAWQDQGLVVSSDFPDDYNAIDPQLFVDGDRAWLAFGSFWSGIKLVEIDAASGKPAADAQPIAIASNTLQPQGAVEAPFIIRRGDFYYLFASYDFCCRGVDSTYNMRVGRSEAVTGPYVDRAGVPLMEGGGTLVYGGSARWRGAGHNAILTEGDDSYLVYHAYDAEAGGTPTLRIERLTWDDEGWPISPSALSGA